MPTRQQKPNREEKGTGRTAVLTLVTLLLLMGLCTFLLFRVWDRVSAREVERLAWQHQWGKQLLYGAVVFLQVVVAVIPGEPLEIAGGYLFGALEGTALYLVAASLGSLLIFCLVRRFGQPVAEVFFSGKKLEKLRFLQQSHRRLAIFLLIFMIPGTPKDLLCYYAGLTDIPWPVFLMVCSVGRLPALVTSTLGGEALGAERYLFAVLVFVAALLLSGIGFYIYDRICKAHESRKDA